MCQNHRNKRIISNTGTSSGGEVTGDGTDADDDLKHPPHIHSLDVECSKTMMTINIEFNRAFDGVIYSKVNLSEERQLYRLYEIFISRDST